jgi:hypothetical protein
VTVGDERIDWSNLRSFMLKPQLKGLRYRDCNRLRGKETRMERKVQDEPKWMGWVEVGSIAVMTAAGAALVGMTLYGLFQFGK